MIENIDKKYEVSNPNAEHTVVPFVKGETVRDRLDQLDEDAFQAGIDAADSAATDKDYKKFAAYCRQTAPNAMIIFDNKLSHDDDLVGPLNIDKRQLEQKKISALCMHLAIALKSDTFNPDYISDKLELVKRVSAVFQRSAIVPPWWTNHEAKSKYRSIGCAIIVQAITHATTPSNTDDIIKNKKITASVVTFQQFLNTIGITIKYNQMSMKTEYEGIPDAYGLSKAPKNELSSLMQIKLTDEYRKYTNRKSLPPSEVKNFIYYVATSTNSYDPWCDYLNSLSWDGEDHMHVIFSALGVEDDIQKSLVKKWLCQTAVIAFNWLRDHPIRSEGVLILSGEEGCGKSTFFENLLPNTDWYASTSSSIDTNNKDTFLTLLGSAVTEIAEIDRTFRSNRSDLKNFIIAEKDTFRKPYAPEAVTEARRTSFCGTTNEHDCLNRDAGYRRWWIVEVNRKIDITAVIKERDQIWAQAMAAVKKDVNCFRLSDAEMDYLRGDAEAHVNRLTGEDDFLSSANWDADQSQWQWLTLTEIIANPAYHVTKLSTKQLGRALTQLKKQTDIEKTRTRRGYKYFVPPARGIEPRSSDNYTYADYSRTQKQVENYRKTQKQVAIATDSCKPDIY